MTILRAFNPDVSRYWLRLTGWLGATTLTPIYCGEFKAAFL